MSARIMQKMKFCSCLFKRLTALMQPGLCRSVASPDKCRAALKLMGKGEYIMNYIFKTKTTMKDYNCKKWFIGKDSVPEMCINADTVELALSVYRERVNEHGIVSISDNAIKTKSAMFVDMPGGSVKQVGYVITGKAEFDKGDYSGWSTQYIDLWVTILTVVDTVF